MPRRAWRGPFDWGVDMTLLALTKYWAGHSDLLMGAVVIREEHWPRLWAAVKQMGICVGGDDAWLVLRGMRTVDVRMRRHQETGPGGSALAAAAPRGRARAASGLAGTSPPRPVQAGFPRDPAA